MATVEFAVAVPVVLALMAWIFDFGALQRARVQLINGVANAAQFAILTGSSVTSAALVSVARNTSMLTGATATVAGPGCYCVDYTPTRLVSATCGASCSNGVNAAIYVTITGTYTFVPTLPGLSYVVNTTLTAHRSVLLQ
jgi:Flp pilus assembly protein TadG